MLPHRPTLRTMRGNGPLLVCAHFNITDMSNAVANAKCKPPKSWKGEYVYKYGRIDTTERLGWLEQIIMRHELYIPKPGELNDPKEARPKIAPASSHDYSAPMWGAQRGLRWLEKPLPCFVPNANGCISKNSP